MVLEVLLVIGGLFSAMVITGTILERPHHQNEDEWKSAAEQLGFTRTVHGSYPLISGHLRGLAIEASYQGLGKSRLTVDGRTKLDSTLNVMSLESAAALLRTSKPLAENVPVHDQAIDQRAYIQGPEPRILALLNCKMRQTLVTFLDHGKVLVVDGMVEMILSGQLTGPQIAEAVHSAVAVVEGVDLRQIPLRQFACNHIHRMPTSRKRPSATSE